jgi:hypothetical protein
VGPGCCLMLLALGCSAAPPPCSSSGGIIIAQPSVVGSPLLCYAPSAARATAAVRPPLAQPCCLVSCEPSTFSAMPPCRLLFTRRRFSGAKHAWGGIASPEPLSLLREYTHDRGQRLRLSDGQMRNPLGVSGSASCGYLRLCLRSTWSLAASLAPRRQALCFLGMWMMATTSRARSTQVGKLLAFILI